MSIFFILIGAVSTYLIYRIGRKFNRTAGVIAALIYAVWMPVVRIERTPYLEGIGSLALLIALYLLPKSNALKNRVAIAGLVIGFAVATKLWFAVPVVIIFLWLLFSKQFKNAVIFGSTALATFGAVMQTMTALEQSYNLGVTPGGRRRFARTRWHFNDAYSTISARQSAKLSCAGWPRPLP